MGPNPVHDGRDAEISDMVSTAAEGLKDMDGHSEEEKAVLEARAITGEKAALTFDSLINFAESSLQYIAPKSRQDTTFT